MLHWQLKKDKYTAAAFNAALWCASISFGLFIIGLGYVWHVPPEDILRISLRRSPARIVLRSLTPNSPVVVKKEGSEIQKKSAHDTRAKQPTVTVKKAPPKKVQSNLNKPKGSAKVAPKVLPKKTAAPKKPVKKVIAPTGKVVEKKPATVAKNVEKVSGKSLEDQKKAPATPAEVKPTTPVKKEPPTQVTVEKEKPVKKESKKELQKRDEAKVINQDQASEPAVKKSDEQVSLLAEKSVVAAEEKEMILEIGSGNICERDNAAFVSAIRRVWRLPRGLRSDLKAQVLLDLGPQGTVQSVAVVRSSGVVAYDLSARAALHRAEYPQVFWGKKICIEFGKELSE